MAALDGAAAKGLPAPDWRRLLGRSDAAGMAAGTETAFDVRVVDLGDRIGSAGWWLGLGACASLCGAAIALAIMVPALPQAPRPEPTPSAREVMRVAGIAPLALGGATGGITLPSPQLVEALAEAPERPRLEISARLGARDSFEGLLRRAGVGKDDIAAAVAKVRPLTNLGALPGGADFDLVLGRRETKTVPRPLERLDFRAAFDLRLALRRSAAGLTVERLPIPVDSTPLRIQGPVGTSLERALRSAGIPARLVGDYMKTMGYAVDFQHGIGRRDRFDIVVERDRAETAPGEHDVRYGQLLFAGLERQGKDPIELGRWDFGGKPQFFRAGGESARKGLMRTPVDGARLTSGFGMRFHPLLAYSRMHQGVDFGAPHGAPILAAANGIVSFAGRHGGHGNYVLLKHNKELNTGYAHMSRFAVRPGQSVGQGQVIGYVGSTGMSTGPHLHYEVWLRGRPTNPVALKFIGGTQLSGDSLARFMAMMNRMRALDGTAAAAAPTKAESRRGRA